MKNKKTISKILLIALMSATIISPNIVFAVRSSKSSSTTNTSYKGATTISSSKNESNKEYSSSKDGESAILVSGGEST